MKNIYKYLSLLMLLAETKSLSCDANRLLSDLKLKVDLLAQETTNSSVGESHSIDLKFSLRDDGDCDQKTLKHRGVLHYKNKKFLVALTPIDSHDSRFMKYVIKADKVHRINAYIKTHHLILASILKDLGYQNFIAAESGEMISPFIKHFSILQGYSAFDNKMEVYESGSVGIAFKNGKAYQIITSNIQLVD